MKTKVIVKCDMCSKEFIVKGQNSLHVKQHAMIAGLERVQVADPALENGHIIKRHSVWACKECAPQARETIQTARNILNGVFEGIPYHIE